MSRIDQSFVVGEQCEVLVSLASADVSVVEGPAGSIEVAAEGHERALELIDMHQDGDVVTVRSHKGDKWWSLRRASVRITAPAGVAFTGRTASGDIRISVPASDVEIDSASGDVRLSSFDGRCRIKTASGDVTIGDSSGGLRFASASGDLRLESLEGDMTATTASGDVAIGEARGSIAVRTASGDVNIRRFEGVRLEASSMSGDFRIWLAPGMTIEADIQTLSGTFRNRVTPSSVERTISAELRLKTLSGDISLH
ncbi:MAG: DUF4097 family beta strand repeat-containing protein [Actinomycetota bacterium]